MTQDANLIPKPCLALMGEFSAGKSTLANLLIGYAPLPVQVIATQLPPVRISYGNGTPMRVGLDGQHEPINLQTLDKSHLQDAAYLQIFGQEDILKHCDLIDMPGISDPNMPAEVWERMIGEADGVLWCSPATQAWRQSEAAVWADLPSELYARSLLLLTRIDKLTSQNDRERVLTRVRAETEGLFADVLPISLLLATQEQDDFEKWRESGAEALANRLIALLESLNGDLGGRSDAFRDESDLRLPAFEAPEHVAAAPVAVPVRAEGSVAPRRVRPGAVPAARPS